MSTSRTITQDPVTTPAISSIMELEEGVKPGMEGGMDGDGTGQASTLVGMQTLGGESDIAEAGSIVSVSERINWKERTANLDE